MPKHSDTKKMAKGGKTKSLEEIQEWFDKQYTRNKLPQTGFFSTLDALVEEAPFEKAPYEQWKNYLKPGRTLEREGVRFPLKQEELDYSFPESEFSSGFPASLHGQSISKEQLRQIIQEKRPDLGLQVGVPRTANLPDYSWARFPREEFLADWQGRQAPSLTLNKYQDYSHLVPPEKYEESALLSSSFAPYNTHFGPEVISHSRTTTHDVPTDDLMKRLRLIEEIQSDRHQDAAEKIFQNREDASRASELQALFQQLGPLDEEVPAIAERRKALDALEATRVRRGYRNEAEYQALLDRHDEVKKWLDHQLVDLHRNPRNKDIQAKQMERDKLFRQIQVEKEKAPDAPFKDPADYATFELRNQLLNAAKQGEDYLGLIRGEDVSKRFSHTPEQEAGTSFTYDKVYRKQLERLARQYGAEVRDVPTNIQSGMDVATPSMREMGLETIDDVINRHADWIEEGDTEDIAQALQNLHLITNEMAGDRPNFEAERIHDLLAKLEERDWDAFLRGEGGGVSRDLDRIGGLMRHMHESYKERLAQSGKPLGTQKTFPSIALTPEVRKKVLEAGVPIWSLAGLAAGLPGLGANEEPEGFAGGGKVRRIRDWLEMIEKDEIPRQHPYPVENSNLYNRILENAKWNPQVPAKDFELMEATHFPYYNVEDPVEWMDWKPLNEDLEKLIEKYGIDLPPKTQLYRGMKVNPFEFEFGEPILPGLGPASHTLDQALAWDYARGAAASGSPLLLSGKTAEGVKALPRIFLSQDEFMLPRSARFIPEDYRNPEIKGRIEPGFAEGGSPEKKKEKKRKNNLGLLSAIASAMHAPGDKPSRKYPLFLEGALSQLYGLNEEGEPAFLGGMGFHGREIVPTFTGYPGAFDEVLALPTLLPEDYVPEFARRANERTERLKKMIREDMGLEEPHGLAENLVNAAGSMAVQLPVTKAKVAVPVATGLAERLAQLGRKIATSPAEWFSPIVEPGIGAYTAGTAFGGGLGAIGDYFEDREREESQIENFLTGWNAEHEMPEEWQNMAEGGTVEGGTTSIDSMTELLRARLQQLSTDMPSMDSSGSPQHRPSTVFDPNRIKLEE